MNAVLESTKTAAVEADTKSWTSLTIKTIVPEGTIVKQDQPLVWFETQKLDYKLRNDRYATELSKFSLNEALLSRRQLNETLPMDRDLAERNHRNAQEDLKYFLNTDRQRRLLSADFSIKMSLASLENAEEELKQLEQMYKEDELTEESEEIILKRARRSVESSQFSLESTRLRSARIKETTLLREFEQLQDQAERQELALTKTLATLKTSLAKQDLELAKLQHAHEKQEQDLADLISDRKRMILKSPMPGIVYHGKCQRGKWSGGAGGTTRQLTEGGSATGSQILITVVDPRALIVRVDLSEKDLQFARKGLTGTLKPTGFPNLVLPVEIASVSLVPLSADKYDCQLKVARLPDAPLMPGMTGKVTFQADQNDQALSVPAASVFDENGGSHVYVVADKGPAVRRDVVAGRQFAGKREILKGLKVGESISLSRP
ncbi:MAG: HlyD family efflux transporter periplasmic adaptor subunit [Planctomycetaceae bacterium]